MSSRAIAIAALIACVLGAVALSYWFSPAANRIDPAWIGQPLPPCFENAKMCGGHILGTDEIGRDAFARLVVGTGVTLELSVTAAFLACAAGAFLGALARSGFVAGFLILNASDAVSCFATWPFILVVVEMYGAVAHTSGLGFFPLAATAALLFWPETARAVARDTGMRDVWRTLPGLILRAWATIILLLAVVDFFGFGVQPPTPSLGNMLSNMQSNLQTAWWAAVFPGIVLFALVFAIELSRRLVFGDPDARQGSVDRSVRPLAQPWAP